MAITTPSTYDAITEQEIQASWKSSVHAAAILTRIFQNANWFFAQGWRPPLANVLCYSDNAHKTATYVFPIDPSADALTYDFHVCAWLGGAVNVKLVVKYATSGDSTAGPWNDFAAGAFADVSGPGAGDQQWTSATVPAIPANATHLQVTFDDNGAATTNVALQHLLIVPHELSSLSTSYAGSGFIAFDDLELSVTGSPINTEMINRYLNNIAAIVSDRTMSLMCLAWPTNYAPGTAQQDIYQQELYKTNFDVPTSWRGWEGTGNGTGGTVSVKVRCSSNATTSKTRIGDAENGCTPIDNDDTDNVATDWVLSTLQDQRILCQTQWGDSASSRWRGYYIAIELKPSITAEQIQGVAPLAALSIIRGCQAVMERELRRGWPVQVVVLDPDIIPGTRYHFHQQIPTGAKRLQGGYCRCIEGNTAAVQNAISAYSDASGGGANDEITVPSPWSEGTDAYPFDDLNLVVGSVWGGQDDETGPGAPMDRMFEITPGTVNQSTFDHFEVDYVHGFGGRWLMYEPNQIP